MTTTTTIEPGMYVTVDRHRGVAWYVRRRATEMQAIEPDWDEMPDGIDADTWWPEEDDFEEVETGQLVCVMVGDDAEWTFDPADLTPIDDEEFCHCCGQVGCCW